MVKAGVTAWTVGLFGDETANAPVDDNYLRFSTSISITTNFDVPPVVSSAWTVPNSVDPTGPSCNNAGTGWIGASSANGVTFNAKLTTEMSESLEANFDIWDNNLNNGSNGATVVDNPTPEAWVGSGGTASTTYTGLQDGHTYGWGVQAQDDNPPCI
ncbi:hypothetical protein GXW82_23880 [Streptacidiphilus sp. 4-A2]|nr:hypothetical protein [Streptacidiphilus sp. 4-A2]